MATNTIPTKQEHTAANNSDGNTSGPYAISFDYLEQTSVEVRVNNDLKTQSTQYTFPTKSSIQFESGHFPTAGDVIEIKRNTDITTAKVDFQDGSVLNETDLDNNSKHILFGMQETKEDVESLVSTFVGGTPPVGISNGARWYDSVSGRTFVYYQDADSAQWVEAAPAFDADIELLNLKDANIASDAAISQSKIATGTLPSGIQVNSTNIVNDSIVDADVNSAAAISAAKLSFTQTSGTARTIDSKFKDTISVKDFGALGNGSNNDTAAIQNALNAAAGTANVFLPAGTYIVHDTILIPSNTYFHGSGEASIIKMQDNIDIVRTLVRTGQRDQKRKNIVIEHMTLDFNRSRFTNPDGTSRIGSGASNRNDNEAKITDPRINDGTVLSSPPSTMTVNTDFGGDNFQDIQSTTLCICFSENVLVNNVKALNAYKHCIDVTAPKYRRSVDGDATKTTPAIYDTVARNAVVAGSSKTITVTLTGHGFSVDDQIYLRITGSTAHDGLYDVATVASDGNSFTVTTDSTVSISANTACLVIQDQASKNVIIQNCYAEGAGDDNITTHHSTDILITGCESRNPAGTLVTSNSNCYEIDDGSRNVTITNCVAVGGCKGLQIKGHDYAPAPYNITIDGLRITNCAEGMDIKHTGRGSLTFSNTSLGGDTITNPDHQIRNGSIEYSGGSPTAKNVSISNVKIIAPRGVLTGYDKTLVKVDKAIQLYAYENVVFTNIIIQDGSFDLAGDFKPAMAGTDGTTTESASDVGELIHVYYNAKNISFKNLAFMGFKNVEFGLRVTASFGDHIAIDGFISQNGPKTAVEITGASASPDTTGQIDNYFIVGDHSSTSGSKGIRNTLNNFYIEENGGRVTGYATNIDSAT